MPYLLAPKALDNLAAVRLVTMEDGHFHCSPSARWEWDYSPNDSGCFNKGELDRGVMRAYRDWVDVTSQWDVLCST